MKSGPFNLRNGDFDLREAARAAARRVGLTLGEWLDEAIAEQAARLRIAPEDLDESDQVDAIAARLGGLPLDDIAPRRLPRRLDIDPSVRGRLPNMRLLDAAAARLGLPRDHDAPVAQGDAPETQDAIHVARRIADLEDALGRRRGRPATDAMSPPSESRLRRIAESLVDEDAEAPPHRLRRIEARLERLLEQIETPAAAPASQPDPLRGEVAALRQQIDDLSRAVAVIGERATKNGLEPALLELISRIDASRADGVSEEALTPVMHGLLDIRGALEHAPAAAARAIAGEIASLHSRLDLLDHDGEANRLQSEIGAMRTQVETLARHLADLVVRVRAQDSLHEQIASLARHVEDIAAAPRDLADRLVDLVDDLRQCIERLDASPSFRMLERRIEEIAVRRSDDQPAIAQTLVELRAAIDHLAEHPTMRAMQMQMAQLTQLTSDMPRRLADRLDELGRVIASMAANVALSGETKLAPLPPQVTESIAEIRLSLERLAANAGVRLVDDQAQRLINIEERVAAISEKLDAPPIIERIGALQDSLLARIDRLRSEAPVEHIAALRARVEEVHRAVTMPQGLQSSPQAAFGAAQAAHLEDIVSQLASKLERANVGAQDPRALQAIENQVLRIAERLDRHGETGEAIATLDRSIGELLTQIGEARRVTEAPISDTIARDLSGLRTVQDESERRTRATLEAVHETLEKVVDRLALLEGDVGVLRVAPPRDASSRPLNAAMSSDEAAPAIVVEPAESVVTLTAPSRHDMALEMSEPRAAQQSFIAAARRATKLMGRSSSSRIEPDGELTEARSRAFAAADASASGLRAAPTDHSRKVLLGVAGLVLSLGAYQVMRGETPPINAEVTQPPAKVAEAPEPTATTSPPSTPAEAASGPAQASAELDPTPVGSTVRPEPALTTLRALAEQGLATAQFELAARLLEGRGMTRDATQALRWLEKAAAQDYAPAQYRLGALYEKGAGIEQSMASAVRWYKTAAQAGHVRAMHNLGVLLADGVDGRPDYPGAAAMFRRAAEFGLRDSQYNLAVLYVRGLGVDSNMAEAYKFFALAGAQGDADALTRRDEIAARMTAKQTADARRATETFALRTPDPAVNDPPALAAIVGAAPGAPAADASPPQARANADARVTSLK